MCLKSAQSTFSLSPSHLLERVQPASVAYARRSVSARQVVEPAYHLPHLDAQPGSLSVPSPQLAVHIVFGERVSGNEGGDDDVRVNVLHLRADA